MTGADRAAPTAPEGGDRILTGSVAILVVAAAAALFHLYSAGVTPFTALVQRPVHLALMATLGFLGLAAGRRPAGAGRALSWLLIGASLLSCGYLVLQHEALVRRAGVATPLDLAAGALAVLVVLELTRRSMGWPLVVVALLSLGYALAGPYLPGALAHRGYGPTRLLEHLYLTTEGLWGVPLGVSADYVYLFILFGALLEAAGGGELLIGLASRAAGRSRGGPAKTAALASALMGSLSGSAVANVVTTGPLTIPLMRRAGFRPHFAAAVEAAASTGGQLMPPIMGAGAFILATWTNIPYARVALAATIPALLYYAALLAAIHFRAARMGIEPTPARAGAVAPRLHLLLPLAAIVAILAAGRSPIRAAFWGVVAAAAVPWLRRPTWLDRAGVERALVGGATGAVQVAAACAAAGIVVGVATLTGIGLRMSELIISVSDGRLPVALVLTALGSLVLGMGLPTTAAYVVLAALGAPALVELGVPLLAAHLFVFYFGCISNVTPPVSLAAYAAAGIVNAPLMTTAVGAMALAGTGFIIPFMFVYGPPLLLDGSIPAILAASATALAGVIALAAAVIGYGRRALLGWERALLAAAAIALIFPGLLTDGFGLAALAVVFLRGRATAATAAALIVLPLAGCGDGDLRFLSIGTGGTGGIYYPLGGAIASRLSAADSTRRYTAEVTGASLENVNRVAAGEMDLGLAIGPTVYEAYHGESADAVPGAERLRVVAPLYPNATHVLVAGGAGVDSIGQLAGRRVSVGAPGSGTEQVARQLLEAYGLTYEDVEPQYLSFSESSAALRDDAIAAAIISVGYPASAVLEAMTNSRVRLLPIDSAVADRLMRERPYYAADTIPAGVYPRQPEPVPTLGVMNWVVARDDLEDEVVVGLLRLIRDDRRFLVQVHDIARQIRLDRLGEAPIPLHAAAERWLETAREP